MGNHTRYGVRLEPEVHILNHFQYVGGTDNTIPWERAPSAVCDALGLIKLRMKHALNIDANFNEVLSAAYMERQKMAVSRKTLLFAISLGNGAKLMSHCISFIVTLSAASARLLHPFP